MKKVILLIMCIILPVALCFAGNCIVENFAGKENSGTAILEWKTSAENGVVQFEIQRKSNDVFKTIATQKAKGSPSSYKYIDNDSFLKENNTFQASNLVYYRLKIIYTADSPTYTNEIAVKRDNSTGIKRTFGMLKEMFK